MTEQEKQLLLQDLCSRLPYNIIVNVYNGKYREDVKLLPCHFEAFERWDIKPYLRTLLSMTEEEKKVYDEISHHLCGEITAKTMIYFLNVHHLDYNNFIEKGLAIEAPEGMYQTKK